MQQPASASPHPPPLSLLSGQGGDIDTGGGRHCAVPSCNRLDFLPFVCARCANAYCLDHRLFVHHVKCPGGIPDNVLVRCPVCERPVPGTGIAVTSPDILNRTVMDHIDRGCLDPAPASRSTRPRCGARKCSELSLAPCRDCALPCCAKHRFPKDHACAAASSSAPPSINSSRNASKSNSPALPAKLPPSKNNNISVIVPGISHSMPSTQVNNAVAAHIDAGCPKPKAAASSSLMGWLGLG
ncbi:hypothetical protein HDU84_000280 [Entophlyctis sp. JEL0112]|nr:hypothetical protein HDU84_000280 [Entophlyctis sp. JEL0112]